MQWRVVVELLGADDEVRRQEVYVGGSAAGVCSAETLGLRLEDLDGVLNRLWEPSAAVAGPAESATKPVDDDLDALLASLNTEPPAPAADETEPDWDALLAPLK